MPSIVRMSALEGSAEIKKVLVLEIVPRLTAQGLYKQGEASLDSAL